ncbi:MAG TPA: hypothetical protein VGI56_13885, partial [Galbitalea sp.]
ITGLYEWYEAPSQVTETGVAVSLLAIFEQWVLVEGCFQTVFGIDLEDEWLHRSWRWFDVRLSYLLQNPNPLRDHFNKEASHE